MKENNGRTALVTGATSGLGFEAAAQLAEGGYASVTITGRSAEKAAAAKDRLVDRTGRDVFETLVADLGRPDSIRAAGAELTSRGNSIDTLLLNAGMVSGSDLVRTEEGIEITFASSLIGHHQLTMLLLEAELLSENARIVIAGSEAARGDVPTFKPVDLQQFAAKHFAGDLDAAARSLAVAEGPAKFKANGIYANAKRFVAWWSAALARRLPKGMTVNAVSPGSVPETGAARNGGFFLKRIMLPVMKAAPARFGFAAPVAQGAARYLEAAGYDDSVSGEFFASAPRKMTGPLHEVDLAPIRDEASQEAVWNATVKLAGGIGYPTRA